MKIYFLSALPCALFLNDVYYGITDLFERFVEVPLQDRIFARFYPQNEGSVGFFLDENLRDVPPKGVDVYLIQDGIAVYVKEFPPTDFSFSLITQQRFDDALVTVFKQGALQLSIESELGYFTTTLPPCFTTCQTQRQGDVFLLKSETQLGVYNRRCALLLLETVLDYSVETDVLSARLPLPSRLRAIADCKWQLSEEACRQTAFTLQSALQGEALDELLPYAFFESLLFHGDYAAFLSEELAPQAEKIKQFLGEFSGVVLTNEPNVCGLVKKKKAGLFQVDYYTVEIQNGKILDVKG